jgi:hypothetical protein
MGAAEPAPIHLHTAHVSNHLTCADAGFKTNFSVYIIPNTLQSIKNNFAKTHEQAFDNTFHQG